MYVGGVESYHFERQTGCTNPFGTGPARAFSCAFSGEIQRILFTSQTNTRSTRRIESSRPEYDIPERHLLSWRKDRSVSAAILSTTFWNESRVSADPKRWTTARASFRPSVTPSEYVEPVPMGGPSPPNQPPESPMLATVDYRHHLRHRHQHQ